MACDKVSRESGVGLIKALINATSYYKIRVNSLGGGGGGGGGVGE